jgi:hypothetical protein
MEYNNCFFSFSRLQPAVLNVNTPYHPLQAGQYHEHGCACSGIIFCFLIFPGLKPGAIEAGKSMVLNDFLPLPWLSMAISGAFLYSQQFRRSDIMVESISLTTPISVGAAYKS